MSFGSQEEARALGDPTRYELYRYLCAAGRDVDIAELTEHSGLHHNAVRQHLAKLVAAGLVDTDTIRRPGRPGRPPLVYRPAAAPPGPRPGYEQLAGWLTEIVATGRGAEEVGRVAGGATAEPLVDAEGSPVDRLGQTMAAHDFAPITRRRGGRVEIVLQRCPYATAALTDPDTICALHRGLATGAAERLGGVQVDELIPNDPRRAGCRLLVTETGGDA